MWLSHNPSTFDDPQRSCVKAKAPPPHSSSSSPRCFFRGGGQRGPGRVQEASVFPAPQDFAHLSDFPAGLPAPHLNLLSPLWMGDFILLLPSWAKRDLDSAFTLGHLGCLQRCTKPVGQAHGSCWGLDLGLYDSKAT